MRILFTGASSFTGMWFARELAAAGHEVTATFRSQPADYTDALRHQRVERVLAACQPVHGCAFGDESFLAVIRDRGPWDVLCHHGAEVTNYKSPEFNVVGALASNTHQLPRVVEALRSAGCQRVVLTGSVFEQNEGAGSQGLPAFSPYGLSKGLTAEVFKYHVLSAGLALGKFVIPNPFGPFEEPRFTSYLVKNWMTGATPAVQTPAYVRDNIHVSLLARAYVRFVEQLPATGLHKLNPSGYAESQGAFTLRFAEEMRPRLGLPCAVELKRQTAFAEPRVRINTDVTDARELGWDEGAAWDELAAYYRELHLS